MSTQRKLLSIVTPCYNEEAAIRLCYETVRDIMERELPGYDYEHIFSDNASTDGTVSILRELAREDGRVRVIINARNFGPFCSVFNALINTRGDAVVALLAADLQDPPQLIPQFVRRWEEGYGVVYGIRKHRQENPIIAGARKLYYRLVNKFSNIDIPHDAGEFQLIDRAVIEALRQCDDYYPYIRGMIANCGFDKVGIEYTWRRREKGTSKNRFYHMADQGLNGLISFTRVPLRLCMIFGFALAAASILYAMFALTVSIIYYGTINAPGIPTLIVAIFFFSGVQLFFFGVLGEYIGAIHAQVRRRPLVVERERINFEPCETDDSERHQCEPVAGVDQK